MVVKLCIAALVVLRVAYVWAAPEGKGHAGHEMIADSTKGHGHGWQDYGWSHPKYKYGYAVKDSKSWDKKTAAEWRDGNVVKGHYSLQEPDGSWRTVNYVADEKGFRAQVHRSPNHHPSGQHKG